MGGKASSKGQRALAVLVVVVLAAVLAPVPDIAAAEPVSAPTFSHDRGFYAAPISVTLSSATPDAQIRYTTTGKAPTATSGTIYTSPITISKPTVLRAIAYRAGLDDSPVESRTYIFPAEVLKQPVSVPGYGRPIYSNLTQHDYAMDPGIVNSPAYAGVAGPALESIPTISIAVDPADIMRNGRWGEIPLWGAYGFYDGGDVLKPMSAELIDPAHPASNGSVLGQVKGHAEPKMKRSMELRFSKDYGPGYPSKWSTDLFRNGPLSGDSAAGRAKKVVLRAGFNAGWANMNDPTTFTEDQWFRDTQIAAAGYGAHGTFVHVYINGLYWGMYNAIEKPDEHWEAEYFGGDDDDYFSFDDDGQVDWDGDPARFQHLSDDLLNRDMSDPANYAELLEYLDVDNLADYLAIEFYMRNGDWPDNNYKGGNRNAPAGPVRFFAWDGDASWASGAWVHPAFLPGGPEPTSILPRIWHALRVNPEFMLTFADHVQRLTSDGGALSDDEALARFDTLNSYVRDAVVDESARWGDSLKIFGLPTRTRDVDWQREVDRIRALIPGNGARLIAALRSTGYFPVVDAPVVEPAGGTAAPGQQATITDPNATGTVYYTADGSDPRAPGGAVSATALAYTSPVDVSNPVRVRSRVFDGTTWSAESDYTWSAGEMPPLRVTELNYNPQATGGQSSDNLEFLEIENVGNAPVDLAGVTVSDAITFDFTGSSVEALDAGEHVVVARNPTAFAAVYGNLANVVGPYSGKLSNDGELVRLSDGEGRTVQEFTYSPSWYPTTAGGGHSLTIRDPQAAQDAWSTPEGWRASSQLGGTPGVADEIASVSADLASIVEGDAGSTQLTFRVWIDRAPPEPVTVDYATGDVAATAPDDYTPASGQLTFDPAGPNEQFVSVDVQGDTDPEADENLSLGLSVTSGPAIVGSSGVGTIVNDDELPGVSAGDVIVTEGTGGTTTLSFAVTVDRPVTAPVTVQYRTRDMTATAPVDYTAATGVVQFAPGGPESQEVAVTVEGDSLPEGTEQFELLLSDPVGAVVGRNRAVGTITDDDTSGTVATVTGSVQFQDSASGKTLSFTANIPAKADAFGNRGTVQLWGSGTLTDGQYFGRNALTVCGPGCTAGAGWAFFKSSLGWRYDSSTTPATMTAGKYSGPVVAGGLTVTFAP